MNIVGNFHKNKSEQGFKELASIGEKKLKELIVNPFNPIRLPAVTIALKHKWLIFDNIRSIDQEELKIFNTSAKKDVSILLHSAAVAGLINVTTAIINNTPSLINTTINKHKATPLHYAAFGRKVAIVNLLLAKGPKIDALDLFDQTVVHYAVAQKENVDVIKFLCKKGTDINAETQEGCTPLHIAAQEGYKDAIKTLISLGANLDPESIYFIKKETMLQ